MHRLFFANNVETYQLSPIGIVRSALLEMSACPLQESEGGLPARIELHPDYLPGARDLKAGDKIILLTWLDRAARDVLATHPRNDVSTPLTGVFSTRSPDRPNPVGIHYTEVIAVLSPGAFEVSRLEVLNGTPVIDIKPQL